MFAFLTSIDEYTTLSPCWKNGVVSWKYISVQTSSCPLNLLRLWFKDWIY